MYTTPRSLPTLAVFLVAVGSAAAMTACGPEKGDPVAPQVQTPVTSTAPAPQQTRPVQVAERRAPPVERHLGRVTGIEAITEAKKPTGAGAVIGGVVGGVVGNQIGDGNGRKVATVVGAVGGGFAGNEIEKRRGERVVGYRVSVRMDDGETRSVRVGSRDGLEVGERVRVEGNDLIRI
ncbi:MAG: glycine zipper 2TM domain-containing protein [Rhizobacter sp.]